MKETLLKLIKEKNQLHPENPVRSSYFDKTLQLLKSDKLACLKFIEEMEEEQIFEISPFFGALAGYFKSADFIQAIEKLPVKFPDLKHMNILQFDIEEARKAMG